MAEGTIRINKVLKDFNIGLSTLADFLKKKGYTDELTLTSKISEDVFALVAKEFGKEQLIKEQSRKVAIKVKEITEMANSRPVEEEEPVKEVIIKTNVLTEQKKATLEVLPHLHNHLIVFAIIHHDSASIDGFFIWILDIEHTTNTLVFRTIFIGIWKIIIRIVQSIALPTWLWIHSSDKYFITLKYL